MVWRALAPFMARNEAYYNFFKNEENIRDVAAVPKKWTKKACENREAREVDLALGDMDISAQMLFIVVEVLCVAHFHPSSSLCAACTATFALMLMKCSKAFYSRL